MTSYHSPDRQALHSPLMSSPRGAATSFTSTSGSTATGGGGGNGSRGIGVAGANTPTRRPHTSAQSGNTTPALSSWFASEANGSPTYMVGTPVFSPTMQPPKPRNYPPADFRNNSPARALVQQQLHASYQQRTNSPLVTTGSVGKAPSASSGPPAQYRASTPSGKHSSTAVASSSKVTASTPTANRQQYAQPGQQQYSAPSATATTYSRRAATPTSSNPSGQYPTQQQQMASTINGNLASLLGGAVLTSSSPVQHHNSRLNSPTTMAQLASSYSDYDLGMVATTPSSHSLHGHHNGSSSAKAGMIPFASSAVASQFYAQLSSSSGQTASHAGIYHAHSSSNPPSFHYQQSGTPLQGTSQVFQQHATSNNGSQLNAQYLQQPTYVQSGSGSSLYQVNSFTAPNSGLATPITHTRMSAGSARRAQYLNSTFNNPPYNNNVSFNGSFSNSVASSALTSPVAKVDLGGAGGAQGGSTTPLGPMDVHGTHYYYPPQAMHGQSATGSQRPSSSSVTGHIDKHNLHTYQGTTDGSVCSSNGAISHSTGASESNGGMSSQNNTNMLINEPHYHHHHSSSSTRQGGSSAIQQTASNVTSSATVGVRRRESDIATTTGSSSGLLAAISRGSPLPTTRPPPEAPSAAAPTAAPIRYRDVTALDDLLAAAQIGQPSTKIYGASQQPQQQQQTASGQATIRRDTVARLSFNEAVPSSPTAVASTHGSPMLSGSPNLKRPPPLPSAIANFNATAASATAQPATPRGSVPTAQQQQQPSSSSRHHSHAAAQSGTGAQSAANTNTASASSAYAAKVVSSTSRTLLSQYVHRWASNHQENQACYKENGYLSVKPGMQLQSRYVLIAKLGWGEFSTVWLGYDKRTTDQRNTFVAVKIAKCGQNVTESTKYEIGLLKFLRDTLPNGSPATPLVNAFEHRGEFGTHQCLVMPLCGSNLLCIIDSMKAKKQRRREKEITMLKEIAISILQGLVDLEAENIIHTDLKPENILCANPDPKIVNLIQSFIQRNAENIKNIDTSVPLQLGDPSHLVNLADFGLSVLVEPQQPPAGSTDPRAAATGAAVNATRANAIRDVGLKRSFRVSKSGIVSNSNGVLIQTREYRAPEILLGCDFNARTDVWSVGCIVYELITGDFLLDPKRKTSVEREMDVEHLAMIMQILGPVPPRIAGAAKGGNAARAPRYLGRYFSEEGAFIYAEKYKNYPRRSLAVELEQYLEPAEAERAAQFIMTCFTYDPMERPHASDLLRHSWLRVPSSSSQ